MNIIMITTITAILLAEIFMYLRKKQNSYNLKRIAHDIRSPLAVLESEQDDQKTLQFALDRIRELSNGIVTAERETKKNKICAFKSKFILEQIAEAKRLQFKNLNVDFKVLGENVVVYGEKNEFISIVSNIINNAVEAMGVTGTVTIKLITDKYFNRISISDTGTGFSPEILVGLGKVTMSTKVNGNGLGLYNAFHAMKNWGGSLDIDSNKNGSTVTLNFPKIDMVLLDDDELTHLNWNILARRKNCTLLGLRSVQDLMNNEIEKDVAIYIDKNLRHSVNGLEVAKALYERGYKNLHLVTGETELKQSNYKFLKSISTKVFPNIKESI